MGWLIGALFVLLIIGFVIHIATQYWYITLALVAVGLVILFYFKGKDEEECRKEAEAAQRAAEAAQKAEEMARIQHRKEEQEGYYRQMIVLGEKSIGLFESMPKLLSSAEKYLDQAEVDFSESAFAPFWDSIENAAKTLGRFNEGVCYIKDNSSQYTEMIKKYEYAPPQFPLARRSVEKLGVAKATSDRMKAIVRTAQRNFQFAMIYEQRKTNKILVSGFTNLANALDRMTSEITSSIYALTDTVDGMSSTLNESMRAIHSQVEDIAKTNRQHYDELKKEAAEGAERENRALEMLDNIQRRRRPSLTDNRF